jgi:quercetin dioxygenase-like cupin family protein
MRMKTFYDRWLAASRQVEDAVSHAPVLARGRDLQWTETPQDARVAMLIGEDVGFPTQGTALLKAEIPAGWHTGKHVHGEEAIYVVEGTGFSVVNGARYEWKAGTSLHIPYMAEHQHFNTGPRPAVYLSALTQDLDLFVKLGRLVQLEEKGPNPPDVERRVPAQVSQFAADGRRIALHSEDALDERALDADRQRHDHGHAAAHQAIGWQAHRHGAVYVLMGREGSPSEGYNGFRAKCAAITNIFEDVPMSSSHKHAHTEAMLYVLEGSGYSEVDGRRYDWQAGDAVHVPPKMTVHEHFNNTNGRTRTLRIEFGIRYFYEGLWEGYHKVEHRPHAQALA